ncbi:scrFIAM [Symbiodinium natans]|uniref:ScrFIAM protein n=1 Tax=Symbiodinium natans TaxID=878477 RepID=A0A812R9M0_9DINO|nr:scrFIAM [Symbiodinium natans]
MGPKQKKPRSLTKQDSAEPGLMIAASRRVVLAADIVDGTMLHALALENLQQFKSMHPDSPLCCGQAASQPEALELSWASACSGSEGAFYVTEAMNAAYKRMSVPVSLEHVFSCERAPEKQKWIQALLAVGPLRDIDSDDWPPAIDHESFGHVEHGGIGFGHCVFQDITELKGLEAACCKHNRSCDVPSVDILVVGTSCKDLSRLNHTADGAGAGSRTSKQVLAQASSRGGSAQTFAGLLGYVESHRPLCVLYENVDAINDQAGACEDNNLKILLGKFHALGYEAQPVMTDACEFGLPVHRHRVYILLVNKRSPKLDLLSRPLDIVMQKFRQLVSSCARSPPCLSKVLLDDDHEAVEKSYEERLARAQKSQAKKSPSTKTVNWVNQHMKHADSLGVRWASAPGEALQGNKWFQLLTEREADALKLSEVEAPSAGFRNLAQSIGRNNFVTRQEDGTHLGPTMLPGQLMWTNLTQPQPRLLSGFEAMMLQGFPIGPCLMRMNEEGYLVTAEAATAKQKEFPTDSLLQDLAGNAMALPVVLSMMQAALSALWLQPAQQESNAMAVETALGAMFLLSSGGLGPGDSQAAEDDDEDF